MNIQNTYRNRMIFAVLGFGLAGAIWGWWDLYGSTPRADYPLTIFGAILLGILGGLGLALPITRNAVKIGRIVGLGLVGAVLGFIAAWAGIYNLPLVGGFLFSLLPIPASLGDLFGVGVMPISVYWLNFVVAGSFLGLFFAFGMKKKWLPMVVRGATGFGLAAIIAPIIGNLAGDLVGSLFVSYLVIFVLIGMALGLALMLRLSKKEKEGSRSQ